VRGISKGVMPHFEDMLSPEQIRAIVDYERSL
jgi:mono/diheme cytochrome c family protein